MDDQERHQREREAVEVVTARLRQDEDAWGVISADLVGMGYEEAVAELLARYVGLVHLTTKVVTDLCYVAGGMSDDVNVADCFAAYVTELERDGHFG